MSSSPLVWVGVLVARALPHEAAEEATRRPSGETLDAIAFGDDPMMKSIGFGQHPSCAFEISGLGHTHVACMRTRM